MFASYRSNFFASVKDRASRPGQPRPPRFYRRGQRARLRYDYQDFTVLHDRLYLPESLGPGVIALVDRRGEPLLHSGDRLVELRIEPCRSRQWVHADFVLRRKPARLLPRLVLRGNLFVELGVARLVTCLDEENIVPFFVCSGLTTAILQRGAKWHAKLRSESKLGVRHGKHRAGQLAARSAAPNGGFDEEGGFARRDVRAGEPPRTGSRWPQRGLEAKREPGCEAEPKPSRSSRMQRCSRRCARNAPAAGLNLSRPMSRIRPRRTILPKKRWGQNRQVTAGWDHAALVAAFVPAWGSYCTRT